MRKVLALVSVLCLVLAACGDDDEPTPAAKQETEPAAVFVEETFVDDTRPTTGGAFAPPAETRTIETRIAYPEPLAGELPLVILGHGMWGSASRYTNLMTAWAEAGYVVAAPTFPRSTVDQPGGSDASDVNDVVNQPADVSFVIDEMLRLDGEEDSVLFEHVDEANIGVAGHSLGGITAYGAVFNTCCRDDRITAGVYLAGPRDLLGPILGGTFEPHPVPSLLIVADGDEVYESSRDAYPTLAAPKWLVTLHGGGAERHATPFEDAADPSHQLVVDTTIAFWDMHLQHDSGAEQRLEEAAQPADGSATLEVG